MDIVVITGGASTEREVSLSTGNRVCKTLNENGHRAVLIDAVADYDIRLEKEAIFSKGSDSGIATISDKPLDIAFLKKLKSREGYFGKNVLKICKLADIVFIALHGETGENGKLQACFDLHNIKYTGSDYLSCALSMNKIVSRAIFKTNDISITKGYSFNSENKELFKASKIGYPCVVKVASGGSSIGVSIVNNDDEFASAVKDGLVLDSEFVVEQFIKGREFAVGVLGEEALPVIEIAPVTGFYDYKNKYQKGMAIETCPADISEELAKKMQDMALRASRALGSRVYSRFDFLIDDKENIYCLENNSLPGMTPTSLVPQEAEAVGMSYYQLIHRIIELSLKKYA